MQQASPFFSVVIATYNREKFLSKAIESVLQQTFTDWELLVVDDGSTDKTKELVASFSDSRIRYIYQVNKERSAARNNGIRNASGQYICFLDSDDYYLENHLAVFQKTIAEKNYPVAFLYSGSLAKSGEEFKKSPLYNNASEHPARSVFYHFILPDSVCIHKDILAVQKFNVEQNVFEDTNLWMRIMVRFPVIQIAEYTNVCVQHEGRGNEKFFKDVDINLLNNYIQNINQVFEDEEVAKIIPPPERRQYLLGKYHMAANAAAWTGQFKKLRYILSKMIGLSPSILFSKKMFLILKEAAAWKYRQINPRKSN